MYPHKKRVIISYKVPITFKLVARSDAHPPGPSRVQSSCPENILSWRFGHEKFLRPLSTGRAVVSNLLVKECALSTSKLPRRLAQGQYVA